MQEFNSQNEGANPIIFEYKSTSYAEDFRSMNYYGDFDPNFNQILSGDFDGDGRVDLTNTNQIHFNVLSNIYNESNDVTFSYTSIRNLPFNLEKDKAFAITTLDNDKLMQAQSILKIEESDNSISLKAYKTTVGRLPVNLFYTRNISIPNLITTCIDNCTPELVDGNGNLIPNPDSKCATYIPTKKTKTKYLEGDFNGDSISELLVINFNEIIKWELIDSGQGISDTTQNSGDLSIGGFGNENFTLCKTYYRNYRRE